MRSSGGSISLGDVWYGRHAGNSSSRQEDREAPFAGVDPLIYKMTRWLDLQHLRAAGRNDDSEL